MSMNNRALSVLRNVKEMLNGQFSDVDLIALSTVSGQHHNFERVATMIDNVTPLLIKFGNIANETTRYLRRQQASAKRFRIIMILMMTVVIFGCLSVMYAYGKHPGPWHVRATYFLGVIITCMFVLLFVRVLMVTVEERTRQLLSMPTGDLDYYRINLSDNLFIRFANARLRGAEAVKDFRKERVDAIQKEFDESNQFDFCSQQQETQVSESLFCTVLDPCSPNAVNDTMAVVLRRHFSKGPQSPCAAILREMFRTLQDVRDGSKVTQLDQYFLWTQITKGVETIRSMITWDAASKGDVQLGGSKMLEIIKVDVVGALKLSLVEVANLSVPPSASMEVTNAQDKSACWKACYDRGEGCRWATFEEGRCSMGTTDVIPGRVSSVFEYRAPSAAGGDTSDEKAVLVRGVRDADAPDGNDDSPSVYVCSKGISAVSMNTTAPLVYSGKLTLDTCTQGTDCDVLSFTNSAPNSVPSVASMVRAEVKGYSLPESESYRAMFSDAAPTVKGEDTTFCRKTRASDIVRLNPERIAQTFAEMETAIKGRIMFVMENYQFRIPLGTYRAYIVKQLQHYYGDAFSKLAPQLLDTLAQIETAVANARSASALEGRYVTLQRFKNRLIGLTTRQRTTLSAVAADMSRAAFLHHRYFKPYLSDMDLFLYQTLLVYGVLLAIIGLTLFGVQQAACLLDNVCGGWGVLRKATLIVSLVMLMITLVITTYRKAVIKREYNRQVADTNGRGLVQKTAEFMQVLSGSSSFDLEVALVGRSGSVVRLQANRDGMMSPSISTNANVILENLKADGRHPGNQDYKAVRITLRAVPGASALKLRSLRAMDVKSGFSYTFSRTDAVTLNTGQSVELPVRQVQSYTKANPTETYDLQVNTSENISDYDALFMLGKNVVETFDKCNTLTQGMRALPFPVMDVGVMVVLIVVVLGFTGYMMGALRPLEKVKNVRSLFNVRKKIRFGEVVPEFDALITCCKTPNTVWERLLNTTVVMVFSLAIYATYTLSNTAADFRGGLFSSVEYSDSKCI